MFTDIRKASGICLFLALPAMAQVSRPGGGGSTTPSTTTSRPTITPPASNLPDEVRLTMIRGKVVLGDGAPINEPIVIERVCNGGTPHREGFTDFKGNFEIQLGQELVSPDATESGRDALRGTVAQTQGPTAGTAQLSTAKSSEMTRPDLIGCELRASLPGFTTSSVMIRMDGSSWAMDVGTIVLSRMENVQGTTISMTTMSAPSNAKHAYQKGEKALMAGKYADAEKEFRKAVTEYPGFAAAWSMLAEVDRHKSDLAAAKEDYLHSISADPKFVNPYYGLTVLCAHEKSWPDTLKYSAEVTRLNPMAYPLTNMYSAVANYYLGNYDAAESDVRAFEKADARHQHPDSSLLLSNILLAKHDYDGSARALEAYLAVVPTAPNFAELTKQIKKLNEMSQAKKN